MVIAMLVGERQTILGLCQLLTRLVDGLGGVDSVIAEAPESGFGLQPVRAGGWGYFAYH